MLAFIYSFILLFAAAAESGEGAGFWDTYLNYPGFEAWRFFNLAIFIAIMVYLLRKPLSDVFKAKRDAIRADLIRAEEEKQAALAQLTATEARLAGLEAETNQLLEQARLESEEEKQRMVQQTEEDIMRMREQAETQVERLALQTKSELRRFSAEESIRRAEEKIKAQMNAKKDARLVKENIQTIGGLS